MIKGGFESFPEISAPISRSGLMTLPIGLVDKDSSPHSSESNSCALSNPDIKRIEVPELPRLRGFLGFFKPLIPTP